MPTFQAVIWMNHTEAHVLRLACGQTHIRRVCANHQHGAQADAAHAHGYFDEVAQAVADAHEILVTGPADAKLDFVEHLHAHHAALGARIVGVETLDHPSDAQLAAYARKFFTRTERPNDTPGPA
jgi:hypothetical protein